MRMRMRMRDPRLDYADEISCRFRGAVSLLSLDQISRAGHAAPQYTRCSAYNAAMSEKTALYLLSRVR